MQHALSAAAGFKRARRLAEIEVSEILTIGARAASLRRAGRDVIVLGAGEPDFDTPDHIKEAAYAAMIAGATKYTALEGTLELKNAIRDKFRRDNGTDFALDEIIVSAGAKQVLFNAMMATLDPGDEVILPAPCWTTYMDIVTISDGKPVLLPCREQDGFMMSAANLAAAITPRTRWVFINSPSNPTGAVYDEHALGAILDVLRHHPQVMLLADDIYEELVYDGPPSLTPARIAPDLRERILTVNGVSKAYAMTGWRLGYAAGPRDLIAAMAVVQSQSTTCASSVSQAAAVAALNGPREELARRKAIFQKRRDYVVAALNAVDLLSCVTPRGAFYAYANCSDVIGKRRPDGRVISNDSDFCSYLLDEYNLALVPGSAFGLSPFVRLSYAASDHELQEACARLGRACASLC